MAKNKPLTELEIAGRLRTGKSFQVFTKKERQSVLNVKRILGINVTTILDGDCYRVLFVK